MPHFLIKSQNIKNDSIVLTEPNLLAHLAGALRLRVGEELKLIDEKRLVYFCEVKEVSRNAITVGILSSEKSERFLPFKITLVQSVLKPDAQSLAISNAAQMGVDEFLPVLTDNSTVKFNVAQTKSEKWQKVADEAFKQCERADLMKVLEPTTGLKKALADRKNVIIFAERDTNATLKKILQNFNNEITLVIGPEGGFSAFEFEFFKHQKYPLVSIGNLILKAPNAITAGISQITYEFISGGENNA